MSEFDGFPKQAITFLKDLGQNNRKDWFDAHRSDYDAFLLEPSRAFVEAMGLRLRELAPAVVADPRVNQSLFRINRDTRFSKDKSPYKTHIALVFWEGPFKKMENSSFYFHFDTSELMIGAGIYAFSKDALQAYRESVVHPEHGAALAAVVAGLRDKGYNVSGQHYKKVPRGYDADHENVELLLHNGLTTGIGTALPTELHTPALLEYCMEHFTAIAPLHRWLVDMTHRMAG